MVGRFADDEATVPPLDVVDGRFVVKRAIDGGDDLVGGRRLRRLDVDAEFLRLLVVLIEVCRHDHERLSPAAGSPISTTQPKSSW